MVIASEINVSIDRVIFYSFFYQGEIRIRIKRPISFFGIKIKDSSLLKIKEDYFILKKPNLLFRLIGISYAEKFKYALDRLKGYCDKNKIESHFFYSSELREYLNNGKQNKSL